jgi:hypothetical protein
MLTNCNLFHMAMHFISGSPLIGHAIAFNAKITLDPFNLVRDCKFLVSHAPAISYYKNQTGSFLGQPLTQESLHGISQTL